MRKTKKGVAASLGAHKPEASAAGLALAGGASLDLRPSRRRTQVSRRRLERLVVEQTRQLAAVNAVAAVASRSLHLKEILADVLAKTLEVTELEAGGLYLRPERGDHLALVTHQGLGERLAAAIDPLQVGEGFSGRVAQTGEPLIVPDLAVDPRLTRLAVQEGGFHSLAVVPLVARDRVLGTLFAMTRGHREFAAAEISLLTAIGRQIGVAVENARLLAAEQRRAEQFRVIAEVGRRFTMTLEIDVLLQQAVELIQQAFGYYHVGIGLIEGEAVVYRAGAGVLWNDPAFQFKPARLRVGEQGLSGWVAAHGAPLCVPDVGRDPRYVWMQGSQARSELVVPIVVKGETIGVLDVQSDRLDAFDQKDQAVLESLANQAGAAIENARLYLRAQQLAVLEERSRLSRDLHDSVSQALYGVTLYAQAAAGQLAAGNLDLVAEHLRELQSTAQEALAEMRLLIFELRPPVLQEEGLVAALQTRLAAVEARSGVKTEFTTDLQTRLPLPVEEGLYRIAQEALNNVLRHAHARRIGIRLADTEDRRGVSLTVADDGLGFDPVAARAGGGLGLATMEERAARLGGRLVITSRPGEGAQVCVEVKR